MYGIAEIYGLKDPRYPQIEYMYIGYTSGDSKSRLSFHKWSGTAPMKEWIGSLRDDGKEPVLCIIDKVPVTDGPAREQVLIEEYDPPLNQRKGGGGIRKKTGGWSEPRSYVKYGRDKRDREILVSMESWEEDQDIEATSDIDGQLKSSELGWGPYMDE